MRSVICRLFAAAVLASVPASGFAAAPTPAAPNKAATPMDAARKALDEVGDMNYQNKSLNEVIGDLKDKTKVAVTIDPSVYQFGFDPNQPTVSVALKGVKLKDGLRQALAPFGLKCGLTRDGLFISTEEGLTSKQLRQRVSVDCDNTKFSAAVKQLAADCGANVVIDPRLKDKADAAVTLKLEDVPLESAVRLLAEVADLGTVRMSNVLFVTTADRAEKLRPSSDGPTQPNSGVNPFPNGIPGGGFGGVVPLPAVPVAPPPAVAPVVEEKKAEAPAKPEKP